MSTDKQSAETTGRAQFHVGDEVIVVVACSEATGLQGTVISVSDLADDSMPFMVRLHKNYREWPFSEWELEHVYDDEESREYARSKYQS